MQRGVFDLDSHEMMPTNLYQDVFGDIGRTIMEIYDGRQSLGSEANPNNLTRRDIAGDTTPIDVTKIWEQKGPAAPGAIDMNRRVEVLDAMGIDRQLVFPSFGFIGLLLASLTDDEFGDFFAGPRCEHRTIGLEAIDAHNQWIATLDDLAGRQRHVAILPTFDYDSMMADAERLAPTATGGIWIPANVPPGGTSPANERIDPLWSLFEEYDVPVVLHVNTDRFTSRPWWDYPLFQRQRNTELLQSAFFIATSNFVVENYLASMVIGGVFERHPRLRLGIIECGAQWLGPLVERMEMVWDYYPASRDALSKRPAQYVAEQVRVTPFFMEPIDLYLERYPQLADVYCYSSDYPHVEGGTHSVQRFEERFAGLDEKLADKFFRTNAELIMPNQPGPAR